MINPILAGDQPTPSHTEIHCPATPQSVPRDKVAHAGVSVRILLVEDDPTVQKVLSALLRSHTFIVTCAHDGESGWSKFCDEPFDILITDNIMPRLTGLGLLRKVRSRSQIFPVILMSGVMPWHEADLPLLLSPGVALEKPFSAHMLVDGVTTLLNITIPPASKFPRGFVF